MATGALNGNRIHIDHDQERLSVTDSRKEEIMERIGEGGVSFADIYKMFPKKDREDVCRDVHSLEQEGRLIRIGSWKDSRFRVQRSDNLPAENRDLREQLGTEKKLNERLQSEIIDLKKRMRDLTKPVETAAQPLTEEKQLRATLENQMAQTQRQLDVALRRLETMTEKYAALEQTHATTEAQLTNALLQLLQKKRENGVYIQAGTLETQPVRNDIAEKLALEAWPHLTSNGSKTAQVKKSKNNKAIDREEEEALAHRIMPRQILPAERHGKKPRSIPGSNE